MGIKSTADPIRCIGAAILSYTVLAENSTLPENSLLSSFTLFLLFSPILSLSITKDKKGKRVKGKRISAIHLPKIRENFP